MNTVAALIFALLGVVMPSDVKPLPTVNDYQRMFDAVPATQWGGADGALSVKVCNQRVWIFSDTLIKWGNKRVMAHNTAMTQKGMSLHVSMGGQQVIPNTGKTHYWPERITAVDCDTVRVESLPVQATGKGLWDFKHENRRRVSFLNITPAGDLVFDRWDGFVNRPVVKNDLKSDGYGRWLYQNVTHTIRVKGGHLKTTSFMWDDGKTHPIKSYRPILSKG